MLLSYYWPYTKQVSTDLCIHLKTQTDHKCECELTKNSRLESAGLENNEEPRAHAGVWRAVRSPQLVELSLGLPL